MRTFALLAVILLLVILLMWASPTMRAKTYLILSPKKEHFDPTYDRTFHQSMLDRQMDKTRDQKGYTVDDYALADLLFQQHSNK